MEAAASCLLIEAGGMRGNKEGVNRGEAPYHPYQHLFNPAVVARVRGAQRPMGSATRLPVFPNTATPVSPHGWGCTFVRTAVTRWLHGCVRSNTPDVSSRRPARKPGVTPVKHEGDTLPTPYDTIGVGAATRPPGDAMHRRMSSRLFLMSPRRA